MRADRRGQRPLRVAGERRVSGREQRDPADRSRTGEVAGQKREAAPGEGEAEVVVNRAAEEFEVVGRDQDGSYGDEDQQPEVERDRAGDPDRDGRS